MCDLLFIHVGLSRSDSVRVGSSRSDGVLVGSYYLMNVHWEIRHLRMFLLAVSSDSHGIFFRPSCQFVQR